MDKLFTELVAECEKLAPCIAATNAVCDIQIAREEAMKAIEENRPFVVDGEVLGYYEGDVIVLTDQETIELNNLQ